MWHFCCRSGGSGVSTALNRPSWRYTLALYSPLPPCSRMEFEMSPRLARNLCAALLLVASTYGATIPYQGLATDAKGYPRPDGSTTVLFALYATQASATPLWSEAQVVTTRKGLFSVFLGEEITIPDTLFQRSSLFLGVKVGENPEASPRIKLGTAPWSVRAFRADTARYALSAPGLSADSLIPLKDSLKAHAQRIAKDSVTIASLRDSLGRASKRVDLLMNHLGIIIRIDPIVYGTMVDPRDGKSYRTVRIGEKTWMAQNLEYAIDSSWWPANSADSGAKYGRLYTWARALGLSDSCNVKACAGQLPSPARGQCPTGWHVPSVAEFTTLLGLPGGRNATTWHAIDGWSSGALDTYGFGLMPSGFREEDGSLEGLGVFAFLWTADEVSASNAYATRVVGNLSDKKTYGQSLRCVMD